MSDGTAASTGDVIITRRNDRRIGITATDWVKNGDRFTVRAVGDGGELAVTHHDTGRHLTLPATYAHVALGYAATIHAAQGATAETSHTVVTGRESREQLYVALSRGRHANHLHVVLPGAGDEHAAIRRDTLVPPTAVDLLTRILDTDTTQHSATTELRELSDPERRLREAVERYRDALTLAPASAGHLSDPAPLAWLPKPPARTERDEPWGPYLAARAEQVRELAAVVIDRANTAEPTESGRAGQLTRRDPALPGDLAVWTAVHGGIHRHSGLTEPEQHWQHRLQRRLRTATGQADDDRDRWQELAAQLNPRLFNNPDSWRILATVLTAAEATGRDARYLLADTLHGTAGDFDPAATALYRIAEHSPELTAHAARRGAHTDSVHRPSSSTQYHHYSTGPSRSAPGISR